MMSTTSRHIVACLCVLLMAATGVHAQTASAQIVDIFYMGTDSCSGTTYNTTYTAGACINVQSDYFYSYYCSADGSSVYQYMYSDASCSASSTYAIVQLQTTCGFQSKNFQVACLNPSLGPSPPLAFPPAGWLQTSECVNASNSYKPASTCSGSGSGDPNIHCYNVADSVGCHAYNYMGSKVYAQIGCNAEGTAAGTAMFTDSGCSTLIATDTVPIGCYGGTDIQCQGEPLPTLPTIGEITYLSPDCTVSPSVGPPTTVLYAPGVCIGSRMYQCETINGVLSGVLSVFSDPTHAGLCTGTPTNNTQVPGKCVNGAVFLCNTEDMENAIAQW